MAKSRPIAETTMELLRDITKPTAVYMGEYLKNYVEKRIQNVNRIAENAKEKLGNRVNLPGTVSPRVLKAICDEGSFMEDQLMGEYMGGVLASARTDINRDDRGARMVRLVDNLSVYQLRTHYLVYATIARLFQNSNLNFGVPDDRKKARIGFPSSQYNKVMEFTDKEQEFLQLYGHIFNGLHSDNFLDTFSYGKIENLQKKHLKVIPEQNYVMCQPSPLGAELFLWGLGHGNKPNEFIFSSELIVISKSFIVESIPKAVKWSTLPSIET